MSIKTVNFGPFSKEGISPELKLAIESYRTQKISADELIHLGAVARKTQWFDQKQQGLDLIPSNVFSFHDPMLDMAIMLGAVPDRYQTISNSFERYFAMAKCLQTANWFDTARTYTVPEIGSNQKFKLNADKILSEIAEARSIGIETRPVIIGPFTFLKLSKFRVDAKMDGPTLSFIRRTFSAYQELLNVLKRERVESIQIDEPCLTLGMDKKERAIFESAYEILLCVEQKPEVVIATYFESVVSKPKIVPAAAVGEPEYINFLKSVQRLEV